jgi:DNA repair photolyase
VEPKAPAIPSRWAAVERLAAAGVAVTVAAAPLMAMQDPAVFARRARASGASAVWAGGLRLLAKDPFHDVLVRNGWLHILEPEYLQEVREAIQAAFPAEPGRSRRAREKVGPGRPVRMLVPQLQPALFEGL